MVGINEIRPALEAILFAAGDSVETERIAKVLGAEPWDVRQAAEQPLLFCKLRLPRRFPVLCCGNPCQCIDQPCDIFLTVRPGNNADHILFVGKLCTDAVFVI